MDSRARGQAYVEYGLLVGVAVIAFLVGMNVLMGGATTYLAHAEPTPDAAVLSGLPNHVVTIGLTCASPSPPVYTGKPFNCSVTVTDNTPLEPARLPTGTMAFSSTAAGTFSPPCTLSGSGVTSGCTFQYTPTNTGLQDITATYHPTSSHQSRAASWSGVLAVDQTATQLTCKSAVPVGEPSQCSAQVIDLYPGRYGPVPNLSVNVATSAGGTFSDVGALSPQSSASYPCTTDASGTCGTLFRSGIAGRADVGPHTLGAAFAGNSDYDSSDTSTAPPVVVNVSGPSPHPVKVAVACDRGMTPSAPMQIVSGASTTCTATVSDVNPDSIGIPPNVRNPTGITPTGTISWAPSPGSGGTGNLSQYTCPLVKVTEAVAQCTSSFTPTSVGTPSAPAYVATDQFVVTYSSDWIHPDLGDTQDSTSVFVNEQHPVQVNLVCTAGFTRVAPLLIQGASADITQCTVTVTDTTSSGTPKTPTGSVGGGLSANGGQGAFTPASCSLAPVNSASASCQIAYQPTMRGNTDGMPDQDSTHTLSATYSGDWLHPLIGNDWLGSTNVFVANAG